MSPTFRIVLLQKKVEHLNHFLKKLKFIIFKSHAIYKMITDIHAHDKFWEEKIYICHERVDFQMQTLVKGRKILT